MPFPLNSNASSSYSTKFVERPYSRKPCCPNSPSTIIFQGKRSVKRMVIVVVITTVILLFTAIIILILFLAKVLRVAQDGLQPTVAPIFVTSLPKYPLKDNDFICSFHIVRQANSAYNIKNSTDYISAFNMIQSALDNTIAHPWYRSYNTTVILKDLRNNNDDLLVIFIVRMRSHTTIDEKTVLNALKSDYSSIENELGGYVSIERNSIAVTRYIGNSNHIDMKNV